MLAYSVAKKNKNIERCEKVQKKSEFGFVLSFSLVINLLVIIVVILGVMYVLQTNKLATMGYEMKEKENIINALYKDNEALKIHAAELKSMHQLEIEKEAMNLKKPGEVDYLEVDDSVAMGR